MNKITLFLRPCVWATVAAVLILAQRPVFSLTLNEAIGLAKKNLPSYKVSHIRVRSSEALYKASLSPYLPELDAWASRTHELESLDQYSSRHYDVSLYYTLFDWGKRKANRSIARLNLETEQEGMRNAYIDLALDVKVAFYTVIARDEIVEQRRIQLRDASKDFEIAQGRHKHGMAKLSDVLQASVRLEQARFNLTRAEGGFRKSLVELNSLIGRPLDQEYDAQGSIDQGVTLPPWEELAYFAVKRPEIRQAEYSLGIAENNEHLVISEFFPTFSADLSHGRTDFADSVNGTDELNTARLTATWNIFELGKFYRNRSSKYDIKAAQEDIDELKRQFLLDLRRTYEDVVTADKNIAVARQQLKEANHNYSQAFGEYKAGKSDILLLVQAESALAIARVQFTSAKLDLTVSKALLERQAAVENLDQPLRSIE
ncbi:MAG: hypothetical protein BA872_03545 [Desulfobacterales bacterium C00003060]|nr:MAG: hypothetical protein BA861_09755 [Desulfobacterales bacterium S3730MH5]OEU80831.1 MAG: hypothetical protein BA872_03545 [Desulfobacterales bacterium C00003060]